MKRGHLFLLFFQLIISTCNVYAKDFGVYGEVKKIAEEDLLVSIKEKLISIGDNNLKKHQEKIRDRLITKIKRPKSVSGITVASNSRAWNYDPTFTVEEDIRDHLGNIIYKRGAKINPLDYKDFDEEWVFIDGDDILQEEFARVKAKANAKTRIILINGNPGVHHGLFYYFDQFGEISKKLGITKVPTTVRQASNTKLIVLEEIDIKSLQEKIKQLKGEE